MPFPTGPYAATAAPKERLIRHIAGATFRETLLDVDLSKGAPKGCNDALALLLCSYHINDFGLLYAAVRQNAADRAAAFTAAQAAAPSEGAHR